MDIFQNLALVVDAKVGFIYQITVFDGQNLVINAEKDDILSVVLNAEFIFVVVHDIIDSVWFFSSYFFCSKIDLETPEDKTLLAFFRLLKKQIDDVVD